MLFTAYCFSQLCIVVCEGTPRHRENMMKASAFRGRGGGGGRTTKRNAASANVMLASKNVNRDLIGTPEDKCYESSFSFVFESPSADAFVYYGGSMKDFSGYYSIDVDPDQGLSTFEYSDLLDYYKAPCEYHGGTLYSITGSQTCTGDDPVIRHVDNNFPYCALDGCFVDKSSVEASDEFAFCTDEVLAEKDYEVDVIEGRNVLSSECKDQLQAFSPEVPTHPLTFEEVNDGIWDEYYTDDYGFVLDFEPVLSDFMVLCEEEGGYLYKFSDNLTVSWLNYPICLGSSCDAKAYFEELFIPTFEFENTGNFRNESYYYDYVDEDGEYPIIQTYEFLGFEAVSEIVSSPTGSPTSTPTVAPTSSPTGTPTQSPTTSPTSSPTEAPTNSPTRMPTEAPTNSPTSTLTAAPTTSPTSTPTEAPTTSPTNSPTDSPTSSPTRTPTEAPTSSPTSTPTTEAPTSNPTSTPTENPTTSPTKMPAEAPTNSPTSTPTEAPTRVNTTTSPTEAPTSSPTRTPTGTPTTSSPTTITPTESPTGANATASPTVAPSISPTSSPSNAPTGLNATESQTPVTSASGVLKPSDFFMYVILGAVGAIFYAHCQ